MALIYDIVTVLILLFFIWRGKSRGLIKSIAGVLVLILALYGANFIADHAVEPVSDRFVAPFVSDFLAPKLSDASSAEDFSQALKSIGVSEKFASDIISASPINNLLSGAVNYISLKITTIALWIICFIVLLIVLKLVSKLVIGIFKLPVLNFANSLGGIIFGALLGYIIISVAAIILINFGAISDSEIISQTHVLRFIINSNPFGR